jgi:hypothetical protein
MKTLNFFPAALIFCVDAFMAGAADTNIIGWRSLSSTIETNAPQMPTNVIALAGSDYHCVALLADRTVRAWGRNTNGETNVPPGLSNVSPDQTQALMADPHWSVNGFSITSPTWSGRVYPLEHKDNLSDSNWVGSLLVAGTGGTIMFTDPTATGAQRFYRVRRW